MAYLVAIVYPDIHRAAEVMVTLKKLESGYLIDLEDAAYVTKDGDGKFKIHQSFNLTAAGAVGGAFWGTLIGLLFFMPVVGLALGAATGAVTGALSDYGIDDDFIKNCQLEMQANTSAIFMLLRSATMDKVEPELAPYGGRVLYSSLSTEAEQKLQAVLDADKQGAGQS